MKYIKLFENYTAVELYHCSYDDFEQFDTAFITNLKGDQYGKGFYFTNNLEYSKQFGDILYTCRVLIDNPINLTLPRIQLTELLMKLGADLPDPYGHFANHVKNMSRTSAFRYILQHRSIDDFKLMGYDGVIGDCEMGGVEYVAFYPQQITILSKKPLNI